MLKYICLVVALLAALCAGCGDTDTITGPTPAPHLQSYPGKDPANSRLCRNAADC